MSDLAYLTAYHILMEAENRSPGAWASWQWQLKEAQAPLVQLEWTLEDHWQQKNLCVLHAEGHTFEAALIRLAADFQKTQEAKKLHLDSCPLDEDKFFAMVILSDYDIRIESMRNGKVTLAAYEEDRCLGTAEDTDLQTAEMRLAQVLKHKPIRQLEAPDRFARQWSFLEQLYDLDWNAGSCLKTVANSRPNGEIDPVFAFRNIQTRTFLRYSALNPAYAPRQCSGTTFEGAVDLFARSFGWEDN